MLLSRWSALTLVLPALLLSACSSTPDEEDQIADKPAIELYQEAHERMSNGNFQSAIANLQALLARYPFGPHADQVQLDLIYAYYAIGETAPARAAIDRFIRLNPTHKDIDYALFMRGLVAEDENTNVLQELFGIDRSDRDPSLMRDAFLDYDRLIREYPSSKYAPDASLRMISLKNRLARNEVKIAEYYFQREAYISPINRGKYVLEHMSDSPAIEQALEVMARSYGKIGLVEAQKDTLAVLKLNFPNNKMVN